MNIFGTGPQPFQNYPFIKNRRYGWNLWWRGGNQFICRGFNTLRPGGDPKGGVFFNYLPDTTERVYHPRAVLPFFTWRAGRFGGYMGYKAYGFDSAAYLDFPGVNSFDVYTGSVALSGFTLRFSRNVPAPTELPLITTGGGVALKPGDYIQTNGETFQVVNVVSETTVTIDRAPWWRRLWDWLRGRS